MKIFLIVFSIIISFSTLQASEVSEWFETESNQFLEIIDDFQGGLAVRKLGGATPSRGGLSFQGGIGTPLHAMKIHSFHLYSLWLRKGKFSLPSLVNEVINT